VARGRPRRRPGGGVHRGVGAAHCNGLLRRSHPRAWQRRHGQGRPSRRGRRIHGWQAPRPARIIGAGTGPEWLRPDGRVPCARRSSSTATRVTSAAGATRRCRAHGHPAPRRTPANGRQGRPLPPPPSRAAAARGVMFHRWRVRRCDRLELLSGAGLAFFALCESGLPTADAHLNALGLYVLRLGHHDLQHAVLGRGFDGVRLHVGGQGD